MDLFNASNDIPIQHIALEPNRAIDVLRLDLIHPIISGNKWFKLKYNIAKIQTETAKYPDLPCSLVTFGGAYSNHIHACAAAGQHFGIPTIGIIRGEEPRVYSPTLRNAKEWGMQLVFIDRLSYAEKDTEDFKSWIYERFGHVLIIPEGGSNYLGINGCMDILQHVSLANYTAIACAMGTGATVTGLLLSTPATMAIWGIPVLKKGQFLRQEVRKNLEYFLFDPEAVEETLQRLILFDEYHFGGYGKFTPDLISYIENTLQQYNLPLDKIYTSKAFIGATENAASKESVLFIHTGGLQGNR